MKKNMKTIVGIAIGIIIGISTTVGAATVFNSKDITYSSDKTDKTNVKDSLDELYSKAESSGQCPEGQWCYKEPMILADRVEIGDYISMTPTKTTYSISTSLTGYTKAQTIKPSELNLWRVIRKNADGTVDVVSEYVSSTSVHFKGKTGYMNLVGGLNTIAAQYTDGVHVSSTRHMGYSNQIEECTAVSTSTDCPTDFWYGIDLELIKNAVGTLSAKSPEVMNIIYKIWAAGRYFESSSSLFVAQVNNSNASVQFTALLSDGISCDLDASIRPILTLKSDVKIRSGDGKSVGGAYVFE